MGFKQKLIQTLTPKRTEEIKPNLFVQQIYKCDDLILRLEKTSKGHEKEIRYPKYRTIYPAVKNGVIDWKILLFGAFPIKSLLIFALILFLAWSYHHDISGLAKIVNDLNTNETAKQVFCSTNTLLNTSSLNFGFSNLSLLTP